MKKLFTLSVFALAATQAFAQLPVSTSPQPKNAILEEFTGINCVFCPDGHKIAAQITAANPGRAFAVNIHTGGFATPSAGQPDFRTTDGNAIAAIPGMGITGYPQGAVNRAFYPTTATAYAMGRGSWTAAVNAQLSQNSYVNIAGEATIDVATSQLTVNLEIYYTGNSPVATNKLTVMLLQNNINGPQTGASQYNPSMVNSDGSYRHMHALRDVLTSGSTGEDVTPTTQGSLIARTLTYSIPTTIGTVPVDLSNLEIVAFIAETQATIITGAEFPISYVGFTTVNNGAITTVAPVEDVCVNSITPSFKLKNNGSAPITSATVSYSINGGTASTYNFSGNINPLGSTDINLPAITFTVNPANSIDINVTGINGGNDDDPTDNTSAGNFNKTNSVSPTLNLVLKLLQDQYGSEITWKFFNDAGTQIAAGGPYTDLAASGTQLNTHNISVAANGCYRLEVYDSYGDGINSGYGVGNITLTDGNNTTIWFNNGIYSSKVGRNFEANATTGINENPAISSFAVYPNPAQDFARINFNLTETNTVQVKVLNTLGQIISYDRLGVRAVGNQTYDINVSTLPAGFYFVELETGSTSSVVKFSVAR